jgi:hypothetical protein
MSSAASVVTTSSSRSSLRGEAHLQRGTERRYYRCPTLGCRARRCPADLVEDSVLASIADGVLPPTVIDAARAELRKLLETPGVAVAGRQRARLLTRLEQLKKQHAWGDLTDAEYLAKRDATRADLAELPEGDRIRAFDAYRARVLALPDAIEAASVERREELCRIVVQRVVVRNQQLAAIDWTRAARRSRGAPKGTWGPARCRLTTPWPGTWHEPVRPPQVRLPLMPSRRTKKGPGIERLGLEREKRNDGVRLVARYRLEDRVWESAAIGETVVAAHAVLRARLLFDRIRLDFTALAERA